MDRLYLANAVIAFRSRKWKGWSARFLVSACLITSFPGTMKADWPEFRGPLQNGVVANENMPTQWDESTNVRWFTATEGLGWSSPVVSGDRIYFTTATNTSDSSEDPLAGAQRLSLVCLDVTDGKQLFTRTLFEQPADAPAIHKKNSHASPTPIIEGERIYLHFGHQGTACTDLDGNLIWENQEHRYPPVHGNGGSPILVDGKLFLTCDGGTDPYTLAIDAGTGKELWRTPRKADSKEEFSFCTPQYIVVDGRPQIISPGSDIVQSLDPESGEVLWWLKYKGYSVIPRPVYHRGLVFLSTGYMAPQVLAIDPTGSGDVTETHLKWTAKAAAPNTPSFVPYENELIMVSDSGIAASLDVETGKEKWKKRIGGNYSASPTVAGKTLFLQSEEGTAYVFRLGKKLEEVSRNALPGRIFASYAVVDNDWIIRTEGGMYRIGTSSN